MKDPNFMELARDIIEGRMCNKQALFCQIVESLVTVYELGKQNYKTSLINTESEVENG
jgi:hypothetical protein